jgi:hypothetical protein
MTAITATQATPFTIEEPKAGWGGVFVWRAITIDGALWAYRRELPEGHFDQHTPGSLRSKWWGDVMQYFNPVQR